MNPPTWQVAGGETSTADVLWADAERKFCRIWRPGADGTRRPCIAVLPAGEHPSAGTMSRFAHEYALRDHLGGGWALRPLELVREGAQSLLVLEDQQGVPLDRLIAPRVELGSFLRLAAALGSALARMHESGLVHRDIKPANILVDPAGDRLWLTGFGVATRLPREHQSPEPPEVLAGTLAYMAPEQTGRMNRSVDSRTDLYSMGVTLYHALTGSLPFAASDPMGWVHCHIARTPAPPEAQIRDVPLQVSAIVMKLLAKTPEERYQTAAGVTHDLRRCLADWEARRPIEAFPLGQRDSPDRLLMPERLYGRNHEIDTLLDTFDRVMEDGEPRLVLVRGLPGIGKSSVVSELHRVLVQPRGLFASGKFDHLTRDAPYATLAAAFRSLVRRLLTKPEAELREWRDELRHALGPNGALIVELIPELKFIIGEPRAVPDLPAPEARTRFQLALRRFVGVFARPEHPLALFLDDLQWLDAATLDLLENLLVQSDLRYLFLVGAYRDDEVDAAHPLARRLAAMRQGGARVREITLEPLAPEDLGQWIADALRCGVQRAAPLARLVHEKTGGNPFFVQQFMHALAEEGLLALRPGTTEWRWELPAIRERGYTENVADLMARKLGRLPATTLAALQALACFGNAAEASTLARVGETSEDEVHADLWEALRSDLVVRSGDTYRFVHDRVREAAYSSIPENRRAQAHLRIGRLLKGHVSKEGFDAGGFAAVQQLNRGSALVTSRDEREELAELNLRAGKRAKAAGAYGPALDYVTAGAALLEEDGRERRRELVFELDLHRAECEFLTGRIASAEARLLALSPRAADAVERAAVACLLADVYVALHRLDRSVEVCLECLGRAGLQLPVQPTGAQAQAAYDRVLSRLGDHSIEAIADLPLMTDPASCAKLDVLAKIARCALTQMDLDLLSVILCAAVEVCLERGNCDSSCYAYEYFAVVAAWRFGDFETGFRFGLMGHALVERKSLRRYEALVSLTLANRVMPWAKHVTSCRGLIQGAFDLARQSGDHISAVASRCVLVSNLLMGGDPLGEVEKEADASLAFCRRAGFRDFVDAAATQAAFVRNLRGLTRRFGSFDDDHFEQRKLEDHFATQPHVPVFECWYWIRRLQAQFLAGDYAAALESSARAQALLFTSPALLEAAEYEFYAALAHAMTCGSGSADERRRHRDALASHHGRLELWARHCPENFADRAALVAAEIARLDGRDTDAMRLYEEAIRSAVGNGFVHNGALAAELAARFYEGRGFDRIARTYLRDARSGYLQWGADGKARQLEARHPYLGDGDARPDPARTFQAPVEHLDLGTVLKFLQVMSGASDFEAVIAAVMRLGLEHAGAERGLLILPEGDAFRIEAEAEVSAEGVAVALRRALPAAGEVPSSILHYVLRTRETVLLHDARAENPFSGDEYLRRHRSRSVLCMPLLEQNTLVGLIYLENRLAPDVFTPARMTLLRVLASGAAISLENARLYHELQSREARARRLVDSNIIGVITWRADGQILDANDAFLDLVGCGRDELSAGGVQWRNLTPPEWHERDTRRLAEILEKGSARARERELIRHDGTRIPVMVASASFGGVSDEGVSFVLDLTERKRAEQALRESEQQLKLVTDSIPALAWSARLDGSADFLSQHFLEFIGLSAEQARDWGWTAAIHPDDRDRQIATWSAIMASGMPGELEARLRRADGEYRWLLYRGIPSRDEEGTIVKWYGVNTDIEDLKRAEAALAASERNLKLIIDTVPALVWSALPNGAADFFNQHYLDFVGLTAEQAAGAGWTNAVHPDDMDGLGAVWMRSMASGERGEAEARLRRHDGEYRWFLFRTDPLRDESGAVVRWYGVNTDIEDRKRAEAELKRAYDSFADAQRLSHTGNFVADIVADEHMWSEELYRIFEFDPASHVTVRSVRDVVHPDDLPAFDGGLARALGGADVDLVFRIVTRSGTEKHVRSLARVVERVDGRPLFVGAIQDVTETVIAEQAVDLARAELAHVARVTTLNALTASIAHEVNQPLSGIITNASTCLRMLDADPPNLDGARETARRTIRDGNRAAEVITRLRTLFSKREFTPEPVDLNDAIEEVVALSQGDLQRGRVVLRTEMTDGLPPVIGDRVQLQQVVLNLLLNAAEAMREVDDRARDLTIRTELEGGDRARVTVRDAGTGIDPRKLEQIFDAFYTTKSTGMGIGLSVSRSIVERHHGRLWAEPNDGPGTAFAFSIPCQPEGTNDAVPTERDS